jgi:hypothetical protein
MHAQRGERVGRGNPLVPIPPVKGALLEASAESPLPGGVLLGASKSGTTWLWDCLRKHPEIYVPEQPKELHFFSRKYDRGLAWYADHFRESHASQVSVDNSPSYLVDPSVPPRLKRTLPDSRLMILLRHPIERAYSHYCMLLQGGKVTDSPEAELSEQSALVGYGFYAAHLERFMQFFPSSQIMVRLHDDIQCNSSSVVSDFYRFLGVDGDQLPGSQTRRVHPRRPRPRFQSLYNAGVRAVHGVSNVSPYIGSKLMDLRATKVVERAHFLASSGVPYPPLSPEAWHEMLSLYADDIERLEDILSRDLSEWRTREPPDRVCRPHIS